jgi:hypothetical protein
MIVEVAAIAVTPQILVPINIKTIKFLDILKHFPSNIRIAKTKRIFIIINNTELNPYLKSS